MGIVGSLIYKLFSILSGSANFLIPLLLIFWGILFNIQATKIHMSRYISFSLVILLCILVFLDGSKEMDMTLIERIIKSTEYMDITRSGGIIGAIFGFFSYKLLGSLGTYIILSLVIIASIYFMIRPNIEHIIMAFEDLGEYFEDKKLAREEKKAEKKLKLEEKEKKKELKESKKKEIKKVEEKELDNSEDLSESLVIKDYSEDSIPENKDFENISDTDDIEITNDATIETQDDEEEVIDTIKNDIEHKKEEEFIYTYPDTALLDRIPSKGNFSKDEVLEKGKIIENTMKNFGIDSKVVAINLSLIHISEPTRPY